MSENLRADSMNANPLRSEPAPQKEPADVVPGMGLPSSVVAAPISAITGTAKLRDRLDSLAMQMTGLELTALCEHAERVLADRSIAA